MQVFLKFKIGDENKNKNINIYSIYAFILTKLVPLLVTNIF